MKKITLLLITLCIGIASLAQQKFVDTPNYDLAARFSQKDVNRMVFSLYVYPHWFVNSDKFWYSYKTSEGTNYFIVDPTSGTKKEIFNLPLLAMKLTEIVKDPYDAKHIPIKNLQLKDDKYFTFYIESSQEREKPVKEDKNANKGPTKSKYKRFYFKYDIATGALENTTLTEDNKIDNYPSFAVISPDGAKGVFAQGNNLYIMDSTSLRKFVRDEKDSTIVIKQLTKDGTHNFSWGADGYKGDIVLDLNKKYKPASIVWAPNSKSFSVIRYDMSPVKDMWVINSLSWPRPTLESYKYMMPGEKAPQAHMYVFDLQDSVKIRHIKTSAFKDQDIFFDKADMLKKDMNTEYFKHTSQWQGSDNGFYFWRQSRDMKRLDLCFLDRGVDSARVVLEERLNTYVDRRPITLINNGKQFIQWSERNGWANLYLYNADGTLVRNLTDGPYHVDDVLEVNEKDKYVLFSACGVNQNENPYQIHTYKVSLNGGAIIQLDMDDMDVKSYASEGAKYFIANYSRVDYAPATALYNAITGKKIMELEKADLSLLLAQGYKFPERFVVKAADGITNLYGAMYKPYDFDPTKIYPICDYVYPGPQVEANNISWMPPATRTDRLAQIGFIVITVGNRGGHPNRSKWYHNFGYGNLRNYGLEDQKYAMQQLAGRYNYIDINRVGIHGHSGGGFMSTAAITSYPDFFKVAVSCAGNHDNNIYNRWWGETHHGVKEIINAEKRDTTFKFSVDANPRYAYNLKGHLMLVTGDMDDNVHPANTIRMVNALIRANKRFDLLVLPGQRHSFGDMNEYFFWRMADYFSEWFFGKSERGRVDITQINNNY